MTEKTNKLTIVMMIAYWESQNFNLSDSLKRKLIDNHSISEVRSRLDSMSNIPSITKFGGEELE